MKIIGFTFIRNAIRYDYPIVEAIRSILPLCEQVIVAVGNSDDDTLGLIQQLQIETGKIQIIETVWDDTLRENGAVLAIETNKAFDAVPNDADWCIYIQGDEILHEAGHEEIRTQLAQYQHDKQVDGFVLNYQHFYGSYDYVGTSRGWYRREIRIIRNDKRIRSYRDAQGFRRGKKKLNVCALDAYVYHYGWVRPPKAMQAKNLSLQRYWFTEAEIAQHWQVDAAEFDYSQITGLARFEGAHPAVMQARIAAINWQFSFDPSRRLGFKDRFLLGIERVIGLRLGEYRNYRIVR
jgi:glycosyltransferase involved in cell wall biosynthesis